MPKDNQKERIMHYLKVSAEEAEKIIAADKAIDRGERMDFDLSPEQEKAAKKIGNATTKKATKPREKKEKVADEEKTAIISAIFAEIVAKYPQNAKITNAERELSLEIGENHYSITLTKHRKAKK